MNVIVVQGGGELEVGQEYAVRHSRKGTFTMEYQGTSEHGIWVDGVITGGKIRYVSAQHRIYGPQDVGEKIRVRASLCYFIPIEDKVRE